MRRIFLDLDGVMADFDKSFKDTFGVDNRELADDDMWAKINSLPSFFEDLPPFKDSQKFFNGLRRGYRGDGYLANDVSILTACPKDQYEHVAVQKKRWVRKHLGPDVMVIPTAGGSAKPIFIQSPGDILIDDFERNTRAWTKAGGVAILHRDFASTEEILRTLL